MAYQKIMIFRTGALGDFVLTLPVLDNLRLANPTAQIHIVGNTHFTALAQAPYTHLHDINQAFWAPLFAPDPSISAHLLPLLTNTDLVISYMPDPDQVFTKNLQRLGITPIINCPPRPTTQIHAIEHLLTPLQTLAIPTPIQTPTIPLTESEQSSAKSPPHPTLIIHPGSGGRAKRWPIPYFAQLADTITQELGYHIALSSGPADHDLATQMAQQMTTKPQTLTPMSIREFAATLRTSAGYIGNDSGPSHLAAALNIPTCVLFGPTDPIIWGPRGKHVLIIRSPNKDIESLQPNTVFNSCRNHFRKS